MRALFMFLLYVMCIGILAYYYYNTKILKPVKIESKNDAGKAWLIVEKLFTKNLTPNL